MFHFTFHPVFGSVISALLLFLFLGILLLFSLKKDRLSLFRRRVVLGIRITLFLLLALLFFRPNIVYRQIQKLPATLLVLIDRSESMGVCDEANGKSRFDLLAKTLADSEKSLAEFQNETEIEVVGFDETPSPLEIKKGKITLPDHPDGSATAIGSGLLESLAASSGKRILATLLLSDGTQRSRPPHDRLPQNAAVRFRDAQIPVYSICYGRSGNVDARRDVSVREILANDRIFTENELTVTGQIRVFGYSGRTIPLELLLEEPDGTMKNVAKAEVTAESDDQIIPCRFVCRPTNPGEWKLTLRAAAQEGELLTTNNQRSAFVKVIDGGLSVLYLEGALRFEQKYNRLALESSAEIRVDYWRGVPETGIVPEGTTETERLAMTTGSRSSLTERYFIPGKYSAYILGDIDATAFKEEELAALAKRVSDGAGLILLGGERFGSGGGWSETPLADLFPTSLDKNARIPINIDFETFQQTLPANRPFRLTGDFLVEPTEIGAGHYLTQLSLDRQKSRRQWGILPPIDSVYRIGHVKPGAQVLAEAVSVSGGERFPFLTAHLFGSGRVLLLATDATWQWVMGGAGEDHRRFWRQMVLWAAKMDDVKEGELAILLDRARYSQNESVEFQTVYRPKAGESTKGLKIEATVIAPNQKETPVTLLADNDLLSGTFRAAGPVGDYRIRATATSATGEKIAESTARFLVDPLNPELDNPVASPAVLENISDLTGGRLIHPEEFAGLLDELAKRKESLTDVREMKRSLYDTRPVFLLFVLLLTVEWFLRKRWGLV